MHSGLAAVNRFGNGKLAASSGAQWRHTQAWSNWGRGEAWHHGHEFDHHQHFEHEFAFFPWFLTGGFGYWYGWPDYYDYGWPDYYGYYNGWPSYYGNGYGLYDPWAAYGAPMETAVVQQGSTSLGDQYFDEAREDFRNGDYQGALRWAGHAAIEMPQNPAIHELMSLALFALKDYRGAAAEAHAALALGPPIDWPTLYGYYGNVDTYTEQLRALEAFVRDNPKKPEGRFLLAHQYLMVGDNGAAKTQFAEALSITPSDKLAEQLMKRISGEGNVPQSDTTLARVPRPLQTTR
jgi:tetratricopeptide (TPR) repeat protein